MVVDEANPPAALRFLDALPDALASMTFLTAWLFPQFFSLDFLGNLASVVALEVAFCVLLVFIHIRLDLTKTIDFFLAVITVSVCAVAILANIKATVGGMFVLIPFGLIVFAKFNYSLLREFSDITTRKRNFFSGFSCFVCIVVLILVFLLPFPYFGMDREFAKSLPSLGGMLRLDPDDIHTAYAFGVLHFMLVGIMRYKWNLKLQREIWN